MTGGRDEFYGLVQTRLMPSFTPVGFKKVKAPLPLFHKLRDAYDAGLEKLMARGDVRMAPNRRSRPNGARAVCYVHRRPRAPYSTLCVRRLPD